MTARRRTVCNARRAHLLGAVPVGRRLVTVSMVRGAACEGQARPTSGPALLVAAPPIGLRHARVVVYSGGAIPTGLERSGAGLGPR